MSNEKVLFEAAAAVLPRGLRVQSEPPPPAEPIDYDLYLPPVHSIKPLAHVHPVDKRIEFFERPHVYNIIGRGPASTSVTTLAHQWESHFDATSAIAGMKRSTKQAWPRLEYVLEPRIMRESAWTHDQGALLVRAGQTLSAVQPYSAVEEADVCSLLRVLSRTDVGLAEDETEYYVFERTMTDEEIVAKWQKHAKLASNMGTDAHHLAELFFNGLPTRAGPEMTLVVDFVKEYMLPRKLVAHSTEKEIYCAEADVAGSIDLIVYEPSRNLYHIIDFKRSAKLRDRMHGYSKMRAPMNHLDDCDGASYALQTSIYQYILETVYEMPIGERILLCLHPDAPFTTSVPYLKAEVEYAMSGRKRLVAARAQVAARGEHLRCAITNAPLVDAVRIHEGRVVMQKTAEMHDLPFTLDTERRREFDEAVNIEMASLPKTELDRTACQKWRKIMPQVGIRPFAT